ncbi:hypothetical protein FC17_GL000280 [Secundilactobacillus paracollinoides DSM 15502 = JCM 11969]|nr:hypothetical protein FC17_GL000280 [Secundilactobacillus paracollinoides DSM 15502 = JCM 11969]
MATNFTSILALTDQQKQVTPFNEPPFGTLIVLLIEAFICDFFLRVACDGFCEK